jgi:phage shock protein PspC (stress-responsive transcriptional regulator)
MTVSGNVPLDEKLKKMLSDGTISIEDYDRLAKAMNKIPGGEEEVVPEKERIEPSKRKRLHRNWEQRFLAGVCSGIAAHFDLDSSIVRISCVILLIFFPPLTAIIYFLMIFLLPWDNKDAEIQSQLKGHPWWFALFVAVLMFTPPLISILFSMGSQHHHSSIGLYGTYFNQVATFPFFAMIRGGVSGGLYRDFLLQTPPLFTFSLLLIIALITINYRSFKDKRGRLIYSLGVLFLGICWTLIFILGSFSYMKPILIR